jgi:TetR/AcrR family transcriptional regulator, mexJK operon transcriptional repressor
MIETVPRRSQLKREHVRAVAQRLFVDGGFAGTSMDAVAAAAGVSKPTLYRYYQSKEALFAEVLRDLSVRRVWQDSPPVTAATPITTRAQLHAALLAIARSVVPRLLDPTYLGLLRVLIAEIPRFPHLADLYREAVLQEGPRVLSAVLGRARAAGLVAIPRPEVAARLVIGPLLSYVLTEGLLATPETARLPSIEDLSALVDLVIAALTRPAATAPESGEAQGGLGERP